MMTAARLALVVLAVALQVGVFGYIRPLGVMPNLVLIVVILASLLTTATRAVLLAIVGGLLLDIVSGTDPGLRTAFLTLAALAAVAVRQAGVDLDSGSGLASIVALATVTWNLVLLAELSAAGGAIAAGPAAGIIAREVVVNVVLAALLRLVLLRFGFGLPGRETTWRRLVS